MNIDLKSLKDEEYKNFISKLIPNIDKNRIIGIRVPNLRKLAKNMINNNLHLEYLNNINHFYLEENQLHLILIDYTKEAITQLELLDKYIHNIDNWSVCDIYSGKKLKKIPDISLEYIFKWLKVNNIYVKRFAIKLLMTNYLDENFEDRFLKIVADIKTNEYYLKMMIAWFFTQAMFKRKDKALYYINKNILDKDIHNLVIKKCVESLKISLKDKEYLKRRRR